jgi:aminopeptidase N
VAATAAPPVDAPEAVADDAASRGVTTGARPGLLPGSINVTTMAITATYDVKASLNFGTRAFRVSTTIQLRNDSGGPIDRLELNTIATRLGGMKLTAVTSAGKPVSATVHDQTIHVPLGGILGPGQSVTVGVAYSATLRSTTSGSNWLFTRANGIADVHRWIPWISRDVPFDRPNHGDPFITPTSPQVKVAITTDRKLVIASTGEPAGATGLTQTFVATNVRDFAFTAAPDYHSTSTKVGAVTVRVYYRPGFPASSVKSYAVHAIKAYQPLVGAYPYATYDLAQTAGGYGMESPGLTWIPTGAGSLNYLVHHETGHQWFYGIVGSDQAYEPFTDEALTDFLARYVLSDRRTSRCSTARLDLSIYRYSTTCYYEDIYIQGGNLLDDTRKAMGATAFWAGIRDYLATYRFRIATTGALLSTLDAHTPLDLAARFRPRFPSLY